jgi:hypothetical protein
MDYIDHYVRDCHTLCVPVLTIQLPVNTLEINVGRSDEIRSIAWTNFQLGIEVKYSVRLIGFDAAKITDPGHMSIADIDFCLKGLADGSVGFTKLTDSQVYEYSKTLEAQGIVEKSRKKRSDAGKPRKAPKGPNTPNTWSTDTRTPRTGQPTTDIEVCKDHNNRACNDNDNDNDDGEFLTGDGFSCSGSDEGSKAGDRVGNGLDDECSNDAGLERGDDGSNDEADGHTSGKHNSDMRAQILCQVSSYFLHYRSAYKPAKDQLEHF